MYFYSFPPLLVYPTRYTFPAFNRPFDINPLLVSPPLQYITDPLMYAPRVRPYDSSAQ